MKNTEIPKWLERLPLAPEFRPTDTEFADPIAYISKIEKEASAFGICKIIPPLSKPSKKYVLHNLNKSLSKCPELGSDVNTVISSKTDSGGSYNSDRARNNAENRAIFTTRHQELGCEKGKNPKGAKKQVWQSGEAYTIEQFESKSNKFAKSHLGTMKEVNNPLVIEAMFWKSASEKPIYVEYANDVPGSGFGEPEGLLRYFYKRRKRRKRNSFDRNYLGNTDQVNEVNVVRGNEDSNTSFSGRKDSQVADEMEGSAGWKLSNSPWNLQVIARSVGSLTRFMPDDIPGVTSPMVYIGMLFSWFAWHVEDHELHSLNFHHMGSPKTWYSVPGDFAADFEEAIRVHAYGKDADRLVALSLLGEKTTVLSPEVFVSSGIPCCRLVQNPGEFVVTFPRAYHIGFSHGFNCGEAANFGTPKWLTIAKEAAVRRAAMNYLPMLSHQQLLHLLTMSFISRIPRSLLPGVRSSRFRDRQKEERELLVKRAFIEDILHENSLLTALLQRDSSYRAVLWDVELLPSSNKASKLNKYTDAALLKSTGKNSPKIDADDNMCDVNQLNDDYICAIGFDLNDDGLPYDFQIESGSLPCVACGILGFPFMAVLQPYNVTLINLLTDHGDMVESAEDVADQATLNKKVLLHVNEVSSNFENAEGWNITTASLKPRIFCLEHALEVEKLLNSNGGANVLVICHSDFQKIKSHAAAIAEEVALPFHYIESPFGNASSEDLKLIDIAMAIEERDDPAQQDWTAELSISLQHCVKVRKSCPSKNVRHLLNLGGLFCDASFPVPNSSEVKWLSRKFRSKRHLNKELVVPVRLSDSPEIIEDLLTTAKDVKIIQYSRKRYKSRTSTGHMNNCLAVSDILYNDDDHNDPDEDKKNNNTAICVGVGRIGNSCFDSEIDGSTLDENRINCAAEIKIPREEEMANESAVSSEIFDLLIENEYEEDSGQCILSNCMDNNGPPSKFVQKMEAISDGGKHKGIASRHTEPINESTSSLLEEHHLDEARVDSRSQTDNGKNIFSAEKEVLDDISTDQSEPSAKTGSKRKREVNLQSKAVQFNFAGFIRSPCEGLRPRAKTSASGSLTTDNENIVIETPKVKTSKSIKGNKMGRYKCELDSCNMSFQTKAELIMHNENRCLVEGCGKTFSSHKYLVQHKCGHDDERPLKCTWKGCTMSFKWAWARTEHLRVHTGERPYACKVNGCGRTFRYVSDFSRHRRKTGHYRDHLAPA